MKTEASSYSILSEIRLRKKWLKMEFKELLEKKHKVDWHSDLNEFRDCIAVSDLGEWAWENLKETEEIEEYLDQLPSNVNDKINFESITEFADKGDWINLYWEIAIFCLGKEEIEKRLKEKLKELNF